MFLVLLFSHNTLVIFLMMLYVILLSILMIQLSTLSVIKVLICGVSWSWHFKFEFNPGRTHLISLILQMTLVLLIWKWMGLFLNRSYLLRCWYCVSLLNWIGTLLLNLLLRKLESWFVSCSFFLLNSCFISVNVPSSLVWNTIVMSRLTSQLLFWYT